MANKELIALVSEFMELDHDEVAAYDAEVGGLFVSRFLQTRMAESKFGPDNLTKAALGQFLYPGLYTDIDPTNERTNIVPGVPAINHSYPNSVTLNITRTCHVKCTYCFRGDIITQAQSYQPAPVDAGIRWIAEHGNIGTVVVTGGDPFTVPAPELRRVVEALVAIPTVGEIRLDTRVLTVKPSSVVGNEDIRVMLGESRGKVWFYSQINSAGEFHPEVDRAIEEVRKAGVPIINQGVILKRVNDEPAQMRDLMVACISRGIRTDYLYLLDGEGGKESPFRVADEDIVKIFRELWSPRASGLAKPRAVYVDPLTNTKSQLLLSPMDQDNEHILRDFLEQRRRKYKLAVEQRSGDSRSG